jgi:hypothetical protein
MYKVTSVLVVIGLCKIVFLATYGNKGSGLENVSVYMQYLIDYYYI